MKGWVISKARFMISMVSVYRELLWSFSLNYLKIAQRKNSWC
ncbi:hypothetical protein RchiOBHm_Chr7g0214211 [Rosa chinensis]|uniref:Uncharacterized protein n=1 Tax=Rosa chinensis TaxID=74649 RepID=A0A2P6PB65_ROSCH|nr:hypothetical protein RchiOBHm_Chr7g0214211 [Rosa chinensis]